MGSAFTKRKAQVLIAGLDNSGKTSIVQFFRSQNKQLIIAPTVGYNEECLEKYNLKFIFTDVSGQQQYRDMWEQLAIKIDALIFVIDSSDELRFPIVVNEFRMLLDVIKQHGLKIPILIYCNKSDEKEAKKPELFVDILGLKQYPHPQQCLSSSVKTGEGLELGLQWLSNRIQEITIK